MTPDWPSFNSLVLEYLQPELSIDSSATFFPEQGFHHPLQQQIVNHFRDFSNLNLRFFSNHFNYDDFTIPFKNIINDSFGNHNSID